MKRFLLLATVALMVFAANTQSTKDVNIRIGSYNVWSHSEMTRISFEKAYDHAYKEMYDFYKANNTTLSAHSDYKEQTKYIHTIFRSKSTVSESGSGTVSVTDRFGNNYSSTISW